MELLGCGCVRLSFSRITFGRGKCQASARATDKTNEKNVRSFFFCSRDSWPHCLLPATGTFVWSARVHAPMCAGPHWHVEHNCTGSTWTPDRAALLTPNVTLGTPEELHADLG